MATVLAKVDRPVGIRQEITATNDFDGTEPAAAPTFVDDVFKFAAEDAGGEFTPASTHYAFDPPDALVVTGFEFIGGTQTSWALNLEDVDGNAVELAAGTNEATVALKPGDAPFPIVLLWGQKLLLTTAGASAALLATVKLQPYTL